MNINLINMYKEHQINKKLKKFAKSISHNSTKPSLSSIITDFRAFNNIYGTDKDTIHSYIKIYEAIFASIRDSARFILEIGIYSGAFLKVLESYFENAQIYGIDIDLTNLHFGKDDPRINIYELNGTDLTTNKKFGVEHFDLIIEDGSHIPDEQIATFNNYAPLVGSGGIYIMEDINSNTINTILPRIRHIANDNQMEFEIFDLRYIKGRYDDICMIAIKK